MLSKITLKAARVNAGLKQKEAAKMLGVDAGTLRNYEKGKTSPNWGVIDKMREIYGIPLEAINFDTNPIKQDLLNRKEERK